MGAQLRELRRRIRSADNIKKITKAQELIAASRIVKAQQRAEAARPYTETLVRALESAADKSRLDHPLIEGEGKPRRSAVLVVTSDRGFAGAYTSNVIRQTEALTGLLREEDQEIVPFVVGSKGVNWFRFRDRDTGGTYTGFTGTPSYDDARTIADDLLEAFYTDTDDGGVDEIHVVSTHFLNMVRQEVRPRRLFPIVVEEVPPKIHELEVREGDVPSAPSRADGPDREGPMALLEFEPSAEAVLDALLPQYAGNLVYTTLLDAAASEWAARRRAMKSATDNAAELQESLTRDANTARQAEITQEISEIVGGANALADAAAE